MRTAMLLLVGLAIAWPQETEEAKRALAIVRNADGTIRFDDKAPGQHVISINL